MKHVKRSVLLWYAPREMYALVTDIDAYPQFLPWCERAEVVERHEREAALLDLADQAPDLFLVHQQLLRSVGLGRHMRRRRAQRVDAAADEREFAVADDDVAVGQLHLAGADGLDLPA